MAEVDDVGWLHIYKVAVPSLDPLGSEWHPFKVSVEWIVGYGHRAPGVWATGVTYRSLCSLDRSSSFHRIAERPRRRLNVSIETR